MSKSPIWKYFKIYIGSEAGTSNKAECTLCDKRLLSRLITRGKNPKTYFTKPLWNHFKQNHPEEYKLETANDAIAIGLPTVLP